jgi:hypothetical protein
MPEALRIEYLTTEVSKLIPLHSPIRKSKSLIPLIDLFLTFDLADVCDYATHIRTATCVCYCENPNKRKHDKNKAS